MTPRGTKRPAAAISSGGPRGTVWVKVKGGPSATKLETAGLGDVDDLRERVKKKVEPRLDLVPVDYLTLYQSERAFGKKPALKLGMRISTIQGGQDENHPLYVHYDWPTAGGGGASSMKRPAASSMKRPTAGGTASRSGVHYEEAGGAVELTSTIKWLENAKLTTKKGLNVLENKEIKSGVGPLRSDVLVVRPCYDDFIRNVMATWREEHVKFCVISGTPGIGKTTFLHYLLYKFFRGELKMRNGTPYEAVVFGDEHVLLSFKLVDGKLSCKEHKTGLGKWEGRIIDKSLGLFDVSAEGSVKNGQESLNLQEPDRKFHVRHCLVAATPGFRFRMREFAKNSCVVVYFPVWSEGDLRKLWLWNKMTPSDFDKVKAKTGSSVPSLMLQYNKRDFARKLNDFIIFLGSQNVIGTKDAHPMLVIQHCPIFGDGSDLDFPHFASCAGEGEPAGYVSEYVGAQVWQSMNRQSASMERMLERIPDVAPYHFQDLVLSQMARAGGLELDGKKLKFTRAVRIANKTNLEEGVLYRAPLRDFMKSIDAFGVIGKTLYLIRVAKVQPPLHPPRAHVKELVGDLPASTKLVEILYVLPCKHNILGLKEPVNGNPPIRQQFLKMKCSIKMVRATSVMRKCVAVLQRNLCHQRHESHCE